MIIQTYWARQQQNKINPLVTVKRPKTYMFFEPIDKICVFLAGGCNDHIPENVMGQPGILHSLCPLTACSTHHPCVPPNSKVLSQSVPNIYNIHLVWPFCQHMEQHHTKNNDATTVKGDPQNL